MAKQKRCEICKYAEWEQVDTDRGSYFDICGCEHPDSSDDWDSEWGDTTDCPYCVEEV